MIINPEYFNQPVSRKAQHALKWCAYEDDILPLWVADSDYRTSPAIIAALSEQAQVGMFGYQLAEHTPDLLAATCRWLERRHNWHIEPEWLVWVPGIMVGVNACCQLYSNQRLYIQRPSYGPILKLGDVHRFESHYYQTHLTDDGWQIDMMQLAEQMSRAPGGLLVLTNPMNPCGTVIGRQTLEQIADLCERHEVTVCSDEVHCDLILEHQEHIPAGSIDAFRERSITLMSASKTFNIAGLATAFAIIPNPTLREQFYNHTVRQQLWVNSFGMAATVAAYEKSDDWYEAQKQHLKGNRDWLASELNQVEGLSYTPSEATYLAWIDCSGLEVDNVQKYFLERKLALSPGREFGWPDFMRLNFACPRQHLEVAIDRLNSHWSRVDSTDL